MSKSRGSMEPFKCKMQIANCRRPARSDRIPKRRLRFQRARRLWRQYATRPSSVSAGKFIAFARGELARRLVEDGKCWDGRQGFSNQVRNKVDNPNDIAKVTRFGHPS